MKVSGTPAAGPSPGDYPHELSHSHHRKIRDRRKTGGPFENLDRAPDDVERVNSTKTILTNVVVAIITAPRTSPLISMMTLSAVHPGILRPQWFGSPVECSISHRHYLQGATRSAVFFHWPTYCTWISIDIQADMFWECVEDTRTRQTPAFINRLILPGLWQDHTKQVTSPKWWTVTNPAAHIEGIVTLFVRIGDLSVRSGLGVVKNLDVYVDLGPSFISRCIRGIFQSERKVVPWHIRVWPEENTPVHGKGSKRRMSGGRSPFRVDSLQ